MRIGFIGLGVMGRPMAGHLLAAGHEVVCWNRSAPAVESLVADGAVAAADAAEVGRACDVVVTVLPDAPQVREVLLGVDGAGGVAGAMAPGGLVIDCSTIAPDAAVDIAAQLRERGLELVDAPVSGGEVGAVAGRLAVMLGGEPVAVGRAIDVVAPFSATTAHVGPPGSGQRVKAANQMIVAGNIAILAEAVLLLERSGADVEAALRVIGGGLATSRVLENKAAGMVARDFTPGFRIDLHHKDLGIALGAAQAAGIAVPVTGLVAQLVQSLRAAGDGSLDHSALLRALERLSGGDPRTVGQADEEAAA
ncbi:NAD(P)-dependent oxidoreductase [Litorihabitans aurantiacus]|uniref:2-hydroxy-3-oxopropionate reductase n=1 Tax=Litorihabitans aurantiacus TaxID=1930061 RepID=A0AA38CRI0_9MICO|nr:NAD(P)-dependent oxidoreductase [Litorihabitans aurantiacus]GMA32828.1 2-hydroxy-3-oxopropionate reductase [Litorihabitans aurantiacus]